MYYPARHRKRSWENENRRKSRIISVGGSISLSRLGLKLKLKKAAAAAIFFCLGKRPNPTSRDPRLVYSRKLSKAHTGGFLSQYWHLFLWRHCGFWSGNSFTISSPLQQQQQQQESENTRVKQELCNTLLAVYSVDREDPDPKLSLQQLGVQTQVIAWKVRWKVAETWKKPG